MAGCAATARGLCGSTGLLTETPAFSGLDLVDLGAIVFGGHDIRAVRTKDAALEIAADSRTLSLDLISKLSPAFKKIDDEVKLGCAPNSGAAIRTLADEAVRNDKRALRDQIDSIRMDMGEFRRRQSVDRIVVVNLSSTEPPLKLGRDHQTLSRLDALIDGNKVAKVRPSLLYAYAAAAEACPFIHFTPSNATFAPGVLELFDRNGTPYMGRDGKTGETLVKSALAPMFKYRNLQVLSWQGYNLLGDRDGEVLSNPENLSSKLKTKDSLLEGILGYPLHTHVGIDYVPSLGDLKTAWDYIHFKGFLDFRMSMQFIWQGCDAILAAPLVLDMIRLADFAARDGATGPLLHLASFFKTPLGMHENDLHEQWHMLEDYIRAHAASKGGAAAR